MASMADEWTWDVFIQAIMKLTAMADQAPENDCMASLCRLQEYGLQESQGGRVSTVQRVCLAWNHLAVQFTSETAGQMKFQPVIIDM